MQQRICSKATCAREAVLSLSFDYAERLAAIGPLGPPPAANVQDLCALHGERLSVPKGWLIIRHQSLVS